VNCHPKVAGQPAYCPPSHCECTAEAASFDIPSADWACPADRYADGSCRCAAGTEFCGSIEVQLVNGVATFEHLAIGTQGRYQLLAEVIMPDQNTGSNNVHVNGKTAFFDVVTAKTQGTVCRAQAAWRQPNMHNSTAHGEGKAWFFEDGVRCLSYSNAGVCEAVQKEPEYAMDKWCKANGCAEHTLVSHCELYTPEIQAEQTCASNKYDIFGECCVSNHVDACGVCGGDGSSCTVQTYIAEPVAVSGAIDMIFNVSLASPGCSMKNPCMHLNDHTCLPKTFNTMDAFATGDDHHCYWDRQATAEEQPDWKYGTWAIEGRLSGSILTHYENGNHDCYCPAGTMDISKKIQVEEKAKEDFVAALVTKVADEASQGTVTPTEKVTIENSGAAKVFITDDCSLGSSLSLTSVYDNYMCSTHWDAGELTGGKGPCIRGGTCVNDALRSIYLPPMTTAKLFKHCTGEDVDFQIRWPNVDNFGTEGKCVVLPTDQQLSMIQLEGNVLKVEAQVVGSTADCYETECYDLAEVCKADATCKAVLDIAESEVLDGINFLDSLRANAAGVASRSLTTFMTCSSIAQDVCEPNRAADVSSTVTLKSMVSEEAEQIVSDIFPDSPDITQSDVVNPTRTNNYENVAAVTPASEEQPVIMSSRTTVMPVATYSARSRASYDVSRRRLADTGATTMAIVKLATSGNQHQVGSAVQSSNTGTFASGDTGSGGSSGGSSGGGLSAAAAAGIAMACVGVAAALVAGVGYQRSSAPKQAISNTKEAKSVQMTQMAAAEDQTDVL